MKLRTYFKLLWKNNMVLIMYGKQLRIIYKKLLPCVNSWPTSFCMYIQRQIALLLLFSLFSQIVFLVLLIRRKFDPQARSGCLDLMVWSALVVLERAIRQCLAWSHSPRTALSAGGPSPFAVFCPQTLHHQRKAITKFNDHSNLCPILSTYSNTFIYCSIKRHLKILNNCVN